MAEYTEIWLANKASTRHSLQKRANHKLKILAYNSAAQLYPGRGDLGLFCKCNKFISEHVCKLQTMLCVFI